MIRSLAFCLMLAAPSRHAAEPPPQINEPFRVRLTTSKGPVGLEIQPVWAPRAAARFRELVQSGYYDDSRFFRVVKGKWAQFGINGDPALAKKSRAVSFPDEDISPRRQSNQRGTIAFAFAEPNGRGTQVFISLADNQRLDAQGFVPFGRVVYGMEAVDALCDEYGEASGGGIRGGKQDPLFEGGNQWLDEHFPKLDKLFRARIGGMPKRSPRDDR
jgi:peptidyl-prolyl cis-trans isomerase A (cyclophilin A)